MVNKFFSEFGGVILKLFASFIGVALGAGIGYYIAKSLHFVWQYLFD